MMKAILITMITLMLLGFISQYFISRSSSKIEKYSYDLLEDRGSFEIRKYHPSLFSSVKLEGRNYKDVSGNGFRKLASYIFGANESNEKIAMTAPVAMEFGDEPEMRFMIPSKYNISDLPRPSNPAISFIEMPEKIAAAISFPGWANDQKIKKYTEKLKQLLDKAQLEYDDEATYHGYNPPYQILGRKNEIIIELKPSKS